MTQPTTSHQIRTGDSDANVVSDEAVLPPLAAIQQGYEEARASIIDPASAPLNWVHDPADAHPDTEAIDVDALPPPVPHDATPPTEAMTVAAKHLAEQQILDEASLPAKSSPRTGDLLGLRRWWRAFWTP
jgi:hypothetical protein